MHLTDELNKQHERFLDSAPQEIIGLMKTATQQLRNSGIENTALQVGDKAPVVTLKDTNNRTVDLYQSLLAGPVILKFFRGDW